MKFITTTLSHFKSKLNSKDNRPSNDNIYLVSTNYTNNTKDTNAEAIGSPYILYKGDQLIGNSSILSVSGQNGISTFKSNILEDPKYKYIATKLDENESTNRYKCHIIYSSDYTKDISDTGILKDYQDEFLDVRPNNTDNFNNFKALLENIQIYVEYNDLDLYTGEELLQVLTLMPDKSQLNSFNSFESLTKSNEEDKSQMLDLCLFESGNTLYPLGKIYIDKNNESDNYVFSIEFSSSSNPIIKNNIAYYDTNINGLSKVNVSGIYKFSVNKIANNDADVKLITKDINSNEVLAFKSANDDNYDLSDSKYGIFKFIIKEDCIEDTSINFGFVDFNSTRDLVIFEFVNNKYSSLFANFNRIYSTEDGISAYPCYENNYIVNISNAHEISSAIPGVVGQTLFVIDNYTDSIGNKSRGTTMYYWEETNENGLVHGEWVNANLLYTSKLIINEDLSLSASEIVKLKQLLRD